MSLQETDMDFENQIEQDGELDKLREENKRLRDSLQTLTYQFALLDCRVPDDVRQSIPPKIGKLIWPESY